MSLNLKLSALDYTINHLRNWYAEAGENIDNNDLSKLKITKLLFFISAASTTRDNAGLLETFDNFYAMPFGHVESDVQDHTEESEHYEISKNRLTYKNGVEEYTNHVNNLVITSMIDESISRLQVANFELITYDPFQLVDLSHRWHSWQTVFSLAKRNGRYSMKIPNEMIMVEPKFYKL